MQSDTPVHERLFSSQKESLAALEAKKQMLAAKEMALSPFKPTLNSSRQFRASDRSAIPAAEFGGSNAHERLYAAARANQLQSELMHMASPGAAHHNGGGGRVVSPPPLSLGNRGRRRSPRAEHVGDGHTFSETVVQRRRRLKEERAGKEERAAQTSQRQRGRCDAVASAIHPCCDGQSGAGLIGALV